MDPQLEERRIIRRGEVSQLTGPGEGNDLQEGGRRQFPAANPPGRPLRRLAAVGHRCLASSPGEAVGPV